MGKQHNAHLGLYTDKGQHPSNTPNRGQHQREAKKPVENHAPQGEKSEPAQRPINPLVGRSWNELLRLVKLVQTIQQTHQLKGTTNHDRAKKRAQAAGEVSGGLAQSATARAPGGDRPTGQAVAETSAGSGRDTTADQVGGAS
jgi:hypothetical protein